MKQTVLESTRYEGEPVKGSRFIVDVSPSADEPSARAALARVALEFPDASHHCWAWRIASPAIERASDDGEPSGSAGRPILAQLAGRDLVDTAVIVTRYFGGTKLGVGGLVRAYGGAAGEALDAMRLHPWVAMTELRLEHDYSQTDIVERVVADCGGTLLDRSFGAAVVVVVQIPSTGVDAFGRALADATAGALTLADELLDGPDEVPK